MSTPALRTMHICLVNLNIEYYSPRGGGAISTVMMETAKVLLTRGHRVSVVTRVSAEPPYRVGDVVLMQVTEKGDLTLLQRIVSRVHRNVSHWDWPYYDYHIAAVTRALAALDHPPDAIIAHNDLLAPTWLGRVAPRAHRGVWLHNELSHTHQAGRRRVLAATDTVFAVSEHLGQWARTLGFSKEQVVVAPNGVNLDIFFPRPDWQVPSHPVRVLFLGRIEPNKGPDLVVEACARLREEGVPVSLTMAGGVWWYGADDSPYSRALEVRAVQTDAEWLGPVDRDKVPTLVRMHDVLCLPSRSAEGYPLVIAEAKASALAVVTSDRGGQVEAGGDAALLVQPEQPDTVATALRSLIVDEAALLTRKKVSLSEAQDASWKAVADLIVARVAEGSWRSVDGRST